MFRGLGNMASMLGQLGELREKAVKMKAEMADFRATGTSAGGDATVVVDGHMNVISVAIAPDAAEDLNEAVREATNVALGTAKAAVKEKMTELTGGMELPGMSDLLPG